MQDSQRNQLVFWSIGFIILIVAIGLYAARNRIGTMITLSTDHIPPMATFSFVTEDGRMSYGMLKVNPGETFTPKLLLPIKLTVHQSARFGSLIVLGMLMKDRADR